MSAEEVAKAFVQHYYGARDTDASQLMNLYQPASMMTFEGQQFQGPQAIVDKFKQLGRVKHNVSTQDVQPSTSNTALLLVVTGTLSIDGGNPLHFSEMIQLVSTGPGQYYVHNSIFRLLYS